MPLQGPAPHYMRRDVVLYAPRPLYAGPIRPGPVRMCYTLNRQNMSILHVPGLGDFAAFSGDGKGRNNPDGIAWKDSGAIPPGAYYVVNRQSGGYLSQARNFFYEQFDLPNKSEWFALWQCALCDSQNVNGVTRGNFRLHPRGPMGVSLGCVTVDKKCDFEKISGYLRSRDPDLPIPGSSLKAFGTLEVM
ncbi:DUF2778 domain-containing protein [Dyella monticola]|uniref:DUF2778 domain-containing protein n=1 Tax=Dyella monticola TaxID=1927958 RepID=A0A370WVK6_9GAMM|nr:DUF2778 domain-containing protein [Dyella monticola]RDS80188.1 DUF2778 domain-containing protein [Dyella monticola]